MDNHKMTIPNGYKSINKILCVDKIKNLGIDINLVDEVFLSENEIVITGRPKEDDIEHNCDEMRCGSLCHVLYRNNINFKEG